MRSRVLLRARDKLVLHMLRKWRLGSLLSAAPSQADGLSACKKGKDAEGQECREIRQRTVFAHIRAATPKPFSHLQQETQSCLSDAVATGPSRLQHARYQLVTVNALAHRSRTGMRPLPLHTALPFARTGAKSRLTTPPYRSWFNQSNLSRAFASSEDACPFPLKARGRRMVKAEFYLIV